MHIIYMYNNPGWLYWPCTDPEMFLRNFNFPGGGGVQSTPTPSRSAHADNSLDFYCIRGTCVSCTITPLPLLFDVFETFEFSNWRSGHNFVDHGWWVFYAISLHLVSIYIKLRSLFNPLLFLEYTIRNKSLKLIANTSESYKVITCTFLLITL